MMSYGLLGFVLIVAIVILTSECRVSNAAVPHYMSPEVREQARKKRSLLPTEEEAKIIVDHHNHLRATVGDEGEEPIPADMRYMTWDDGLAYTSLLYSYSCKWEHSLKSERRTAEFRFDNGENLWVGSGQLAMEFDPVNAIQKWYDEYVDYEFYNQTCEPNKLCGHYTQVVWATTYKIGCAWTVCPTMKNLPGREELKYFVCQYAPGGNIETFLAYKVGPRCSECAPEDTCWEGALCRNPSRDKIIPFTPPAGGTAVALAVVTLMLAGGGAGAYYLWYRGKLQEIIGWRKKRKVSSAGGDEAEGADDADKKDGGDKTDGVEIESVQNGDAATNSNGNTVS